MCSRVILVASVLAFAPVFLANVIFSNSFATRKSPTSRSPRTFCGIMTGGMLEYLSMLFGYHALLLARNRVLWARDGAARESQRRCVSNVRCRQRNGSHREPRQSAGDSGHLQRHTRSITTISPAYWPFISVGTPDRTYRILTNVIPFPGV